MRDHLVLAVNGRLVEVRGADAFLTVSDFLRRRLGLTGTKVVCAEGDCGACTVLLGKPRDGRLEYRPIDSCILLVFQADGTHIVTPEGVGRPGCLNPVQQAMVDHFGSQCGFCTPGFVTALAGLIEARNGNGDPLSDEEVRVGLSGNLCRCTGYVQIMEAARSLDVAKVPRMRDVYTEGDLVEQLSRAMATSAKVAGRAVDGRERVVFIPATLDEAVAFKAGQPTVACTSGASDLGVQLNKGITEPQAFLCMTHVPGLDRVEVSNGVLTTGGRATWTQVASAVKDLVPQFHQILMRFGSPQIRNVGTVGGNLANASPIADSIPFYFVTDTVVVLAGSNGRRRVPITEFFLGYKKIDMRADELIAEVVTTLPKPTERLGLYKVSRRRDLDISTFTAAICIKVDGDRIASARLAYGGVGPVVLRLPETERFLTGQSLDEDVFEEAGRIARTEITPISDVRGSADFRNQLAENIPLKFFYDHIRPDLALVSEGADSEAQTFGKENGE